VVFIRISYTYKVSLIGTDLAHMHFVIASDPEPKIMFSVKTHITVLSDCKVL
jgi:hypothetical protein